MTAPVVYPEWALDLGVQALVRNLWESEMSRRHGNELSDFANAYEALTEVIAPEIENFVRQKRERDGKRENCAHVWTDMRNKLIESGEICLKCTSIQAGNANTGGEAARPA